MKNMVEMLKYLALLVAVNLVSSRVIPGKK